MQINTMKASHRELCPMLIIKQNVGAIQAYVFISSGQKNCPDFFFRKKSRPCFFVDLNQQTFPLARLTYRTNSHCNRSKLFYQTIQNGKFINCFQLFCLINVLSFMHIFRTTIFYLCSYYNFQLLGNQSQTYSI